MKHTIIFLAVVAFTLAGMMGVSAAEEDTLNVLFVNDTHSHLVPYGSKDVQGVGTRGGIARAASLIGQVSGAEENVLFLHAGDAFVGDFMFNKYFGISELQILGGLGCDAMVLGNHEFDLTPEVLKLALSEAGFPMPGFDILSANLDMSGDPVLATLVKPYVIRDVGDLNVGIFGLTTEETNEFSMPSPVVITSFIEAAAAAVDSLKSKCDLIIALTHIGFVPDSLLALNVPGIDLIVGGHSHTALHSPVGVPNPLGGTTWIVQSGSFYDNVGHLKCVCGPSGIDILDCRLMPVDSSVPEVPEVAATVQFLIGDLEADPRYGAVYSEIIAEAAIDIERDCGFGFKDTPMGNLVTDAYREATGTSIGMAVWGFISQKLYAGPLCGADLFQTVSYGYDQGTGHGFGMKTFELSGMELLMGLEYTTEQAQYIHDLYIQVSGMSFTYDSSQPLGQKVTSVMVGNQPMDPFSVYTVTTNSGLFGFLSLAGLQPGNPQDVERSEYEVVRDYVVDHSPVTYRVEGRIEDLFETSGKTKGDVDGNGAVNVLDAIAAIKHLLGREILSGAELWRADCNGDGQVDQQDIMGIVFSILGYGPCGPAVCKLPVTSEVFEVLESLRMYMPDEDLGTFLALISTDGSVPYVFTLRQNYPNPFNPVTTIEFSIPRSSDVTLTVFNVLGQIEEVLINSVLEAGYYKVQWNATQCASGIYYYCLSTSNFKGTRKMMLIK